MATIFCEPGEQTRQSSDVTGEVPRLAVRHRTTPNGPSFGDIRQWSAKFDGTLLRWASIAEEGTWPI
ncbi:hypothetical protein [Streptomyces aureus]